MKTLIRERQLAVLVGWDRPRMVQFAIVVEKATDGDWFVGTGEIEPGRSSAKVPESFIVPLKELSQADIRDLTPNQAVKKYKEEILAIFLKELREETAKFMIIRRAINKQLSILKALVLLA